MAILERRAEADIAAGEALSHRAIFAANFVASLAVVIAAILIFFGGRGVRDIRRMARKIQAAREQAEEEVRRLQSVDITEEMPADLKATLGELGRRLEFLEEVGQPLDAKDCAARGNAYYSQGDYERAAQWYERAVSITPDDADAHYRRGVALHQLGRHKEAVASFDRVIQIAPDDAEAHHIKGLVLHQLAIYDEAIASYSRAIQLAPQWARLYFNRAGTYARLNRRAEALADLARGIQLDPKCRDDAKAEPAFENLRADAEFRKLAGLDAARP